MFIPRDPWNILVESISFVLNDSKDIGVLKNVVKGLKCAAPNAQ